MPRVPVRAPVPGRAQAPAWVPGAGPVWVQVRADAVAASAPGAAAWAPEAGAVPAEVAPVVAGLVPGVEAASGSR